nr:hypothetical protein [uncultured Pseudomonas sp.]
MGQTINENSNIQFSNLFAALLRELTVESGRGSVERRRMLRHILRGFRAGLLASQSQMDADAMEEALRHGLGLPPTFQRQKTVPAGTSTEGE